MESKKKKVLQTLVVPVCIAAGAIAGYVVHQQQQPVYEAKSSVLVQALLDARDAAGGVRSNDEIGIETEAQLLHSAQVATDAARELGDGVTPEELLRHSSVSIPVNSQVLTVTYRSPSADDARDASRALVGAYIRRREQLAAEDRTAVVQSLEAQLATLNTRLQDTAAALASTPSSALAQVELLESQRDLLLEQISDINGRLVAFRVEPTDGGQIINAATAPQEPVSPVLALNLGAGIVLGALAGGGLLLLMRRPRTRPRDGRSMSQSSEVPVVALGPVDEAALLRDDDLLADVVDAIRPSEGSVVVVEAGEGVGAVERVALTLGLARDLAPHPEAAVAVLPSRAHIVGASSVVDRPGLRDIVKGRSSVQDAVLRSAGSPSVLGPGRDDGDEAWRSSDGLAAVLTLLGEQYAAVVVHARLGDPFTDALLASAARIVVLAREPADDAIVSTALASIERLNVSERVACVVTFTTARRTVFSSDDAASLDEEGQTLAEVTGVYS